MTVEGHGLCIQPQFMAKSDPRLVRVMERTVALTRSSWLIVPSDRRNLAWISVTCAFVADAVSAERMLSCPNRKRRDRSSALPVRLAGSTVRQGATGRAARG